MFGPYSAQSYSLGSEAANLEYTILSAILGNGNSPDSNNGTAVPSPTSANQIQATTSFSTSSSGSNIVGQPWSHSQFAGVPSTAASANFSGSSAYPDSQALSIPPSELSSSSSQVVVQQIGSDYIPPSGAAYTTTSYSSATAATAEVDSQNMQYTYGDYRPDPSAPSSSQVRFMSGVPPVANGASGSGFTRPRGLSASVGIPRPDRIMNAVGATSWRGTSLASTSSNGDQSVYVSVTKPYDYTEGYHFLMKHLPRRYVIFLDHSLTRALIRVLNRFEKNDILRIVRALAIFRPSLIALQMPLSEEDEVFVEKCFQRSLIVRRPYSLHIIGTQQSHWNRNLVSLYPSAVRQLLLGVGLERYVLSGPNSAYSQVGRRKNLSVVENISTRYHILILLMNYHI